MDTSVDAELSGAHARLAAVTGVQGAAKGTVNLGPMAQDFHRLFGMGTETTIDVRDLAALALVAAKAQQSEIDELKRVVADLSSPR